MNKLILTILFNSLIISSFAQQRRYLEDVASPYISVQLGTAIGKYANFLNQDKGSTSNFGIAGGYLMNPYRNKRPSKLFFGPELGFQFDGGDDAPAVSGGVFRASFHQTWLNGVIRYRPILSSTKFNPFFDAFVGYKLISVQVKEIFDEDESEILKTIRKGTMNYGFGIGTGIRLSGDLKNKYLDVAIHYQQNDANKLVRRNSVNLDSKYDILYKTGLIKPNQIVFRVGLTGFLSK
jgi:hypothetical protein